MKRIVIIQKFAIVSMVLAFFCPLVCVAKAGADKGESCRDDPYSDVGVQTNKDGWISRVKRNRVYDELELRYPVSTERWHVGVLDEKGCEMPQYRFQGVEIRRLVFHGVDINRVLKTAPQETLAFSGIDGLEEMRFKGLIPKMEESRTWYGAKDDDWRKGLKRVVIEDDIFGITNLPFASYIKWLSLGNGITNELVKYCCDCYKDRREKEKSLTGYFKILSRLERVEIPYEMAANTNILWGTILRATGLKNKEVISSLRSDLDEEGCAGDAILLNVASSGEISDSVSKIRRDAIPDDFKGRSILLPFNLNP